MHLPRICLMVSPTDRAQLERMIANGNTPQKLVQRARAVLWQADRQRPSHVAARLGVSRNQVYRWTQRYVAAGVPGVLTDAPRPGGRKRLSLAKVGAIVEATLFTRPPAATHWSTRLMAKAQGVSEATVRHIWHQHGLLSHRVEHFKFLKDPHFVDKLRDVVGLYLNPPDKAVVFCVDAKPSIQALDRTRPILPLQPGLPERQTHDYRRHGTTTLFAALHVLDGVVIGECYAPARPRVREVSQAPRRRDRARLDAACGAR